MTNLPHNWISNNNNLLLFPSCVSCQELTIYPGLSRWLVYRHFFLITHEGSTAKWQRWSGLSKRMKAGWDDSLPSVYTLPRQSYFFVQSAFFPLSYHCLKNICRKCVICDSCFKKWPNNPVQHRAAVWCWWSSVEAGSEVTLMGQGRTGRISIFGVLPSFGCVSLWWLTLATLALSRNPK